MANLHTKICGVEFKNPVIAASGTFGFGKEFNEIYDISVLGGISTKGLTLEPRLGNPTPRIAEGHGSSSMPWDCKILVWKNSWKKTWIF